MIGFRVVLLIALVNVTADAFSIPALTTSSKVVKPSFHTTSSALLATLTPVFDFSSADESTKQKSVSSFERIDDSIMGGISLSALKDVANECYASWSGTCRTDGGGFCGMRTLPFKDGALDATGQDGVYLDCRLASDDEADRRMWKMTVRTDSSRGEMVYQAQFDLAAAIDEAKSDGETWARVKVLFSDFQLVRGPRLIVDGPPLNVTGGIFQIGMTMSKFKIAVNTTELENFRAGYFDMHLKQIGFYKEEDNDTVVKAVEVESIPDTLTKKEAESKRPLPLKILLPIAKLLFSEKANRRRSAMNILREKRNMTRSQAILFGIKSRKKSLGLVQSIAKTLGIISVDASRTVFKTALKFIFVYPLRLIGGVIRTIKKMLGMKVKPSMKE
ncbi:hypothetical protein CTEN210_02437 [Chaetoceros tenuissimus]|uniref:NADH:ubiquinone oxidoreductase intermediate-associated protein 30 domain-containing protein n=1 Tax=Chaetoceros tenuissimus TaxID=426638 RepID=A0AAD3H0V5_9STRA|nr:hypothetical protein CTEN210_02437 [Chaetoceros tenuissimus]